MVQLQTKDGPMDIRVGMSVGFKSDVEQYGRVIEIRGHTLVLENTNGFSGEYIGGQTRVSVSARDIWVDL